VDHALGIYDLPTHHQDPFDRLLVAQAQIEGLPMITHDPVMGRYGIRIEW
jgi:PIN domain nuclease of toxin-antitoxin system